MLPPLLVKYKTALQQAHLTTTASPINQYSKKYHSEDNNHNGWHKIKDQCAKESLGK